MWVTEFFFNYLKNYITKMRIVNARLYNYGSFFFNHNKQYSYVVKQLRNWKQFIKVLPIEFP